MNYDVLYTDNFKRELKKLLKKHRSLKADLAPLITSLQTNPKQGVSLSRNCFKIRLAITSKGKGKSGGSRVIFHVRVVENEVILLSIYDKSVQETISETKLNWILDNL